MIKPTKLQQKAWDIHFDSWREPYYVGGYPHQHVNIAPFILIQQMLEEYRRSMITPTAMKLIEERGNLCEVCHMRQATEAHHCLYRRDKHVKHLNDKENLQLVCHICHDNGSADSWANRVVFWQDQCTRYGAAHMKEWHDKIPYKIKETLYR